MQFKKLAIISDCVHVFNEEGIAATENHIFRRQMQALASHFDETLICCPFEAFTEEKVSSIYTNRNIHFIPMPNVGGNTLNDKIKLFKTIPKWWKAFRKVNRFADIVYQRFPNNLNIPGFFYFYFRKKKVFATYTGTWKNYKREPSTYRFQKWLLKKYFKGPVWIYSETDNKKLLEGFSPSYTLQEWEEETDFAAKKIERLNSCSASVPVFVTVGALIAYKNQQFILDAFKILRDENFNFTLYIIGDGPLKESYQKFIDTYQLNDSIFLCGKKRYEALRKIYRESDFLVQSPLTEGFGKTPLEGFFHGVVPVLSDTMFSKKMTGDKERGFIFSTADPLILADLIKNIIIQKKDLAAMIEKGRTYAKSQTIENWVNNYLETIHTYFE